MVWQSRIKNYWARLLLRMYTIVVKIVSKNVGI